jgi:hypothetical protein
MYDLDIDLGYVPRPWQREVHHMMRTYRNVVTVAHRRSGKSVLAIMELVNAALRTTAPRAMFGYVAPFYAQAKTIAWRELRARVAPLLGEGLAKANESELSITFGHNDAVVRLFGGDRYDALRGIRLDGLVLDEVADLHSELWDDVLQPALADRQGWMLAIGTPRGVDSFSEMFQRAGRSEGWVTKVYTVYETNALPPDEIKRLRTSMPERSFEREFLCSFDVSGDDQLLSVGEVEEAAQRTHASRDVMEAPRVIGVDVARFGDDRSVVVKRQGLAMFPPIVRNDINNMELAAIVANEIDKWKADATFIDAGQGAGVVDRLRQLGYRVQEVHFGGQSTRPNEHSNKRTQMWCDLASWVRAGGSIPDIVELKRELATPTYSFNARGQKVLESKDAIKKRMPGGASPDIGDGLALTFASPVRKRERSPWEHNPVDRRFDPYAPVSQRTKRPTRISTRSLRR